MMEDGILIIDDREIFRSAVKHIFIRKNFDTLGISNGKIAMERIRHSDIDLVILKHDLPDWSGLKTLKKIKSEYPDLKVVCIADNLDGETQEAYYEAGIENIVPRNLFFGNTDNFIDELPLGNQVKSK